MVGPLRFYPPYPNGLVVHATFLKKIFSLINSLKRILTIFFLLPIFWAKTAGFQGKKVLFLLSGQGSLPYLPS